MSALLQEALWKTEAEFWVAADKKRPRDERCRGAIVRFAIGFTSNARRRGDPSFLSAIPALPSPRTARGDYLTINVSGCDAVAVPVVAFTVSV